MLGIIGKSISRYDFAVSFGLGVCGCVSEYPKGQRLRVENKGLMEEFEVGDHCSHCCCGFNLLQSSYSTCLCFVFSVVHSDYVKSVYFDRRRESSFHMGNRQGVESQCCKTRKRGRVAVWEHRSWPCCFHASLSGSCG